MNHQRPFFLGVMIILIIIQADHLALGQVACLNNGNYTSNSVYSVNLNSSVSSLDNNIDSNGFYNASVGQGPDTANAMVLCRGDLQLNTCRECVRKASDTLLRSCPVQKQAVTWEESCMVRYSNETIYGTQATAPRYWLINPQNVTSPERFKADLRTLLDGLRERAASGGSLRKVAAGDTTGPDFQSIYALVQCTPDLSPQDCTNCLITAATDIPRCCDGRRGGRVIMPSCQLRFEDLSFFNKTRLDELESMPVPGPGPGPGPGPQPPSQSSLGKEGGNTNRTVIIVVVPIISILIILVVFVILLRKRRTHKLIEDSQSESVVEDISTSESLQYSFNTLKAATNNFSDDNKLGQGGFGAVYKGKLPDGKEIAVKRLSMSSGQGDLEFKNEVVLLVKLQHRNLVRLLGFALEKMEKLLVYEFVENASLDLFIFGQAHHSYLNWDRRYKIIVGIARGLLYLHEDSRLRIIHRDLKASNILLDTDMNPKIADFGMARLFGQDETQGNTSRIVGTYGYMPPEYLLHGQFSVKSDVFSFGVLILEIISGQKNNNYGSGENAQDLLSYAWNNWREGTSRNIVDPLLVTGSGASGSMRDIMRCIHIGLLCVQENVADRPTMAAVVLMLSSSSITLTLPSEPAFYFSSGYGSDVSRLQEYSSRNPEYNSSHKQADQSDHSSQNDASISEFYPR